MGGPQEHRAPRPLLPTPCGPGDRSWAPRPSVSTPGSDFPAGRVLRAVRAREPGIPGQALGSQWPPPPRSHLHPRRPLRGGGAPQWESAHSMCAWICLLSPEEQTLASPPDPRKLRGDLAAGREAKPWEMGFRTVQTFTKGPRPKWPQETGRGGVPAVPLEEGEDWATPNVGYLSSSARQQSCPLVKLGTSSSSSLRAPAASTAGGCVPGSPALRTQAATQAPLQPHC